MNTIQTTLLVLASTILVLSAAYFALVQYKYKNFQRYVKPGDSVDYYIGENRETFILHSKGEIFSKIVKDNEIINVHTADLYPNFWYNYKI